MLAVSRHTARRVQTCYRRDAEVLYPPVEVDFWTPGPAGERGDYYLAASRLIPAKRMELVVEAFATTPERELIVVGDGPEMARLKSIARIAPNVTFVGHQPDEVLRDYLRRARGFVFAGREELGMVMVEALACGTPVIAFGKAGALEIVRGLERESPTGVFFAEQSAAAIVAAVDLYENEGGQIDPVGCRDSVLRFAPDTFRARFTSHVEATLGDFEMPTEFGPSSPALLLASGTETPLAIALSGR
jgi:glycosyltransferase involved in cell wall biosynthesis